MCLEQGARTLTAVTYSTEPHYRLVVTVQLGAPVGTKPCLWASLRHNPHAPQSTTAGRQDHQAHRGVTGEQEGQVRFGLMETVQLARIFQEEGGVGV